MTTDHEEQTKRCDCTCHGIGYMNDLEYGKCGNCGREQFQKKYKQDFETLQNENFYLWKDFTDKFGIGSDSGYWSKQLVKDMFVWWMNRLQEKEVK